MASSWRSAQAPVLDLGRAEGGRYARNRRKSILWPVWLWDVVAPDTSARRLDVLERATLGYAEIGIVDTRRIAARFGLERELIAKVWASLQSRALIGDDDRPTKGGRAALAESRAARSNLVSGQVAVDAFKEIPLAIELGPMRYLECNWEEGRPVIQTGTPGAPRAPLSPSIIECDGVPVHPSPDAIARLAATSSRRKRGDDETETLADAELERFAAQVTATGEPRRAFILIELIAEELMPDAISVRLPRSSPRLVRVFLGVVQEVRRTHGGLDRRARELLGEAAGDAAEQGATDGMIPQEAAKARVRDRFGSRLEEYREPFEQLVAVERKCWALQHLEQPARDSIEDVVMTAQKAVESACEELRKLPSPRPWPLERESRPLKRRAYECVAGPARVIGFRMPPLDSPAGDRLASVGPGKLFSVFKHGGGSLLPKMLSLVVYGATVPEHPIRETARVAPDLLFELVELDRYRNPSSHGGRREGDAAPTVETAVRLQGNAERAVAALLGIPLADRSAGGIDG